MPVTFAQIRAHALTLPGVEEGPWYGKPALKVAGKGFARLHEDGATLVLRISMDDRDFLLHASPETFYLTDHYRNYPAVLARLSALSRKEARELIETSWRFVAPRPRASPAARGRRRP